MLIVIDKSLVYHRNKIIKANLFDKFLQVFSCLLSVQFLKDEI